MANETVSRDDIFTAETIDLDQMAEEVEQLRTVHGTTELIGNRARREWLEPVGKVVRPSFGGKIEARRQKIFDDGQDKFKCGR